MTGFDKAKKRMEALYGETRRTTDGGYDDKQELAEFASPPGKIA